MQRDMVQFRPKLAAILLLSELNMKKRMCSSWEWCWRKCWESKWCCDSRKSSRAGGSTNKRKHPEDSGSLGSQGLGDNTVTAQNLTQCNDGEESSNMFLYMICAMNMSMSKEEMIGVLCDYISTIHDAGALE